MSYSLLKTVQKKDLMLPKSIDFPTLSRGKIEKKRKEYKKKKRVAHSEVKKKEQKGSNRHPTDTIIPNPC